MLPLKSKKRLWASIGSFQIVMLLMCMSPRLHAIAISEQDVDPLVSAAKVAEETVYLDGLNPTLITLRTLAALQNDLKNDIDALNQRLAEATSSIEKQDLLVQIEKLNEDLSATIQNIQEIAAGADIAELRSKNQPEFNFQEELLSLLEPAVKEMKDMTSHVRQKTEQRDRIAYYSSKLPITERAMENIRKLLGETDDENLKKTLSAMLEAWLKQHTFLTSEIQSATLQLEKLEKNEVSLIESSQTYVKSFFQNRGQVLGRAILAALIILLLSRLTYRTMERFIPGYQKAKRPFRIRLIDLTHRVITSLLMVLGPMVVFYIAEDWLLFSVGILILIGLTLTLRHAIPRYWQLAQLFLNVGTVREGERLELNGLPWQVKKINFFTMLSNPTAGLLKRVKIDDLVDMRSRETREQEVWFPCRIGDWVTFDDGCLGKVIGVSEELTELVLLGGAHKTYTTQAFLDNAPTCLSQNFRISQTIGVSYALQAESVSTVCDTLREYALRRFEEESFGKHLLNLAVEFETANTSSLDLAVIADFNGDAAPSFNKLRRFLQRLCVEACTKYDWEIPFTQVTLHQSAG